MVASKQRLLVEGQNLVRQFCSKNKIIEPPINVVGREEWHVSACAYYRPDTAAMREWTTPGINICLALCASPCLESQARNYSWPGNVVDREPYGVIAHELGHHCDWLTGEKKGTYYSEYCEQVKGEANEAGITSYANTNPAEWFAEAFRLFMTNPDLLRLLRPKTHTILLRRWSPVIQTDWLTTLGENVPPKIIRSLKNKGAK